MSEQIKQDIDLIEILFYLKKKILVILFIIAICMAMVLLFLYINKDNIKVSYSLKINQTTPGILVNCDSNNNFACQTTMTEDVIQRITTFFHTSPDVKNREIKLEWSGDK
ncbi:membrane protein, partial [Escherichia coli]